MRKIRQIITGGIAALSTLYWTAAPALATTLCPNDTNFANLCNNTTDPAAIVSTGINILLFVAFVAALGFLIFGGIRWIISGGDKEATAKAKGTVTSALIGLVIVLAAWILLNVITRFFNLGNINSLNLPNLPRSS